VLLLLPGIGLKKAGQLLDLLKEHKSDFAAWKSFSPPTATRAHWPLFVSLMRILSAGASEPLGVPAQVHHVRTFYAPLLEQRFDDAGPRLRDLEQLELSASRFPDRGTFLSEITLDPPSSTQDLAADPLLDEDYLILSTIHSAKGLEWDTVHVIHAADGNIPSDMATKSPDEIEEERRLFYVALTRAKNRLCVCYPQRYYFHGRHRSDAHSYAQLTRFLTEDIQEVFQQTIAGPDAADSDSGDTQSTGVTSAEIRERLKDMWS
jgi:DNA helicase-2/ATP-dependent DNA helicase PcrA